MEKIEFSPWEVISLPDRKGVVYCESKRRGFVKFTPDGTIGMTEYGDSPSFCDGSFKAAALERVVEFATGLLNSAAKLVGDGPPLVLKVSEARILAETQGQIAQVKQERDQATERCRELRRQLDGCAVELADIKKALFEERAELVLLRKELEKERDVSACLRVSLGDAKKALESAVTYDDLHKMHGSRNAELEQATNMLRLARDERDSALEELEKERETSAGLREKLKAARAALFEAGEMAAEDKIGPPSKRIGDDQALKMAAEEAGFRLVKPEHLWELSCTIRETAVQEERLVRAWEAVGGQPEPRATMGMRIVTEKQLTDLVLAAQGAVLDGNHEELERKLEQAWAAVRGEPA